MTQIVCNIVQRGKTVCVCVCALVHLSSNHARKSAILLKAIQKFGVSMIL